MYLLTCDFLAERYPTIGYHANGILNVLKSSISCLEDGNCEIYGGNNNLSAKCDPYVFFSLSKKKYIKDLPPLFNISELTVDSFNYFQSFIQNYELVIGYELTEATVKLLKSINAKYINIWLHPIRYLDDELFLIESNIQDFRSSIDKYKVSENSFIVNAAYAKSFLNRKYPIKIDKNSCVFFGQTSNDKTLRTRNGYLSVSDYREDLCRLGSLFNTVYYAKHPLRNDNLEFEMIKEIFKKVIVSSYNSYSLISSPDISLVITISSSIGMEAYYFGKNVVYLNKPTVDIKKRDWISVDCGILNPEFWSYCLKKKMLNGGKFIFVEKNKIRNLMNSYYSYPILKDHYDGK